LLVHHSDVVVVLRPVDSAADSRHAAPFLVPVGCGAPAP
jgi:hypothetical protein